ncbi:hypothetical protein O181_024977, partial [Austropuccinia psidii MF-1]|nr:hypothetical protein [Austropuccinia psidii MF-1]
MLKVPQYSSVLEESGRLMNIGILVTTIFRGGINAVTGALLSEEGLALSKLGLTYGGLKDM